MNWDCAAVDWQQSKSEVRANWGRFSDSDLAAIAGKRPQLATTISDAYGVTDDEPSGRSETSKRVTCTPGR
jgi:uncharacterized protein YjbJ (UPF0337 family)